MAPVGVPHIAQDYVSWETSTRNAARSANVDKLIFDAAVSTASTKDIASLSQIQALHTKAVQNLQRAVSVSADASAAESDTDSLFTDTNTEMSKQDSLANLHRAVDLFAAKVEAVKKSERDVRAARDILTRGITPADLAKVGALAPHAAFSELKHRYRAALGKARREAYARLQAINSQVIKPLAMLKFMSDYAAAQERLKETLASAPATGHDALLKLDLACKVGGYFYQMVDPILGDDTIELWQLSGIICDEVATGLYRVIYDNDVIGGFSDEDEDDDDDDDDLEFTESRSGDSVSTIEPPQKLPGGVRCWHCRSRYHKFWKCEQEMSRHDFFMFKAKADGLRRKFEKFVCP